jgi:hypothetical protein
MKIQTNPIFFPHVYTVKSWSTWQPCVQLAASDEARADANGIWQLCQPKLKCAAFFFAAAIYGASDGRLTKKRKAKRLEALHTSPCFAAN